MKRVLILVALVVASSASAQTPAGSAVPAGSAAVAPPSADIHASPSAGSADVAPGSAAVATGSAAAPGSAAADSAAATGSGSAAATGSAAAAGSGAGSAAASKGPKAKAWYDVLADKPIEEEGTFWLPKSVNLASDSSDMMFYSVLALSAFFFFAIAGITIYFVIKYRHRPGHKAEPSTSHNDALEITWTVIPTLITVFLFWYGWQGYIKVVTPPQKAVEIDVLAWRWNWQFTHENGVTDSDLHVPANVPVRLVMTSKDVIHSFYAPAMRVKQDVLPRRFTYAWFDATKPGTYRLTCAEYCGTNHSQMACLLNDPVTGACLRRAVVVVHKDLDEYKKYLSDKYADQMNLPPIDMGKMLYDKKGCNQCHTVDGSARVGPSWKQPDWGKMITLDDGSTVKMDENYVKESILVPNAKARPGFQKGVMPSFEGQLKDKEVAGLIAYIKSLKQ